MAHFYIVQKDTKKEEALISEGLLPFLWRDNALFCSALAEIPGTLTVQLLLTGMTGVKCSFLN
jgi:hypothetical protein